MYSRKKFKQTHIFISLVLDIEIEQMPPLILFQNICNELLKL